MINFLKQLKDKWMVIAAKMNEFGIPIPLVRSPTSGRGDVALTLVVISSMYIQLGLIGKWSHKLEGIDIPQALNWFYACSALYWARKLSTDGKKTDLGDTATPEKKDS